VDAGSGRLVSKPNLISRGFVFVPESGDLLAAAEEKVRALAERGNIERLEDRIESALSELFYEETKRRPMIFVLLNKVAGKQPG
jgi:ribonuclease J